MKVCVIVHIIIGMSITIQLITHHYNEGKLIASGNKFRNSSLIILNTQEAFIVLTSCRVVEHKCWPVRASVSTKNKNYLLLLCEL